MNDHADAHELPETLEWLGIGDAGDLAYLGEQRALRAVAAAAVGLNMGSVEDDVLGRPFDEKVARAIIGTPLWRDMRMLLIGCYMDGLSIGWRGHELAAGGDVIDSDDREGWASDAERDAGTFFYERPEDVVSTVFDPADATFGPIMAAIQAGEFATASRLLRNLEARSMDGASDVDYSALSDRDLALALRDAERNEQLGVILYAENEIAGRLDLPLEQTEQGLTPEAGKAIDAWADEQLKDDDSERELAYLRRRAIRNGLPREDARTMTAEALIDFISRGGAAA